MTVLIVCVVIFTVAWVVAITFWIMTLLRVWRVLDNLEKISGELAEDTRLASGLLKGFVGGTFSLVGFLLNQFRRKKPQKE